MLFEKCHMDNRGHNTLRVFDTLPNISFSRREIGAWLLVIKVVYKRYLTNWWTTEEFRKLLRKLYKFYEDLQTKWNYIS